MAPAQFTTASHEEINKAHALLYETHKKRICYPLEYRKRQLGQVVKMLKENDDAIADALYEDMRKPRMTSKLSEVAGIITRALHSAENLEEWAKPEKPEAVPDMQKPWNPTIYKVPKGPVLLLGPSNFPIGIICCALIAAISAGNPALLKPSELTPASSALLAELAKKYLDNSSYIVLNGGVPETTKILELRWAHIWFTGSLIVAKIVAAAAAKFVTPCSLELGGKCPVVIDPDYDLSIAAKRITWAKLINAGATCLTPDYILITKDKQAELVQLIKKYLTEFVPEGELQSESCGAVVSTQQYDRITGLLSKTRGKIEFGGKGDRATRKIELAVVTDVKADDPLMEEEMFGPILLIVPVKDLEEALEFLKERPGALTNYVVTEKEDVKQKFLFETQSGMISFNDFLMAAGVVDVPFSGVGDSGYGYQNGYYGYIDFTHMKSSIDIPKELEQFLGFRYPPFTAEGLKPIEAQIKSTPDINAAN